MLYITWTGKTPTDNSIIHKRRDKFLLSTTLSHLITDSAIKPYPFSDHDYISFKLNTDNIKHGPGNLHFNNELLQDACLKQKLIISGITGKHNKMHFKILDSGEIKPRNTLKTLLSVKFELQQSKDRRVHHAIG